VDRVALSIAGRLSFSLSDRHNGVITVFRRFDAIASRLLNHERLVGGVDFVVGIAVQFVHANVNGPGAELDLYSAIVEVEKRKTCIGSKIDGGRSKLYFCSRVTISPEFVSGGHRPILDGFDPLRFSGGLKRDRALHVSKPSDTPGRIVLILILR
jgi:hypothetical protein